MNAIPIQFSARADELKARIRAILESLEEHEIRRAISPLIRKKLGEPDVNSRQVETLIRVLEEDDRAREDLPILYEGKLHAK